MWEDGWTKIRNKNENESKGTRLETQFFEIRPRTYKYTYLGLESPKRA